MVRKPLAARHVLGRYPAFGLNAAHEVWASIIISGVPLAPVTRVKLTFDPTLKRWQAAWLPGPQYTGLCTVTYFAMSEDSLKTRLLAVPISSALMVVGPTSVRLPWQRME